MNVVRRICACLIALGAFLVAAAPAAATSATSPDYRAVDSFIQSQMSDAHLPGLALGIVHDGVISHLAGFGRADASGRPVTADTPFIVGSVSKSFTALAVMQLVEAGAADLDASAKTYVPDFGLKDAGDSDRITVRQLLNQTSGIPTAAGIDPLTGPVTSLADQVHALAPVVPQSAPGAAYAYSNANYEVLGRLVELVSGQTYSDYLQQHVFGPLGMTHSFASLEPARTAGLAGGCPIWFGLAQCLTPGTGYRPDFVPAGFVISTASDMSRYMLAQLDGGSYAGQSLLSPAGVAEMHTAAASAGLSAQGGGYGMGWFAGPHGHLAHTVWHDGSAAATHSMVLMLPDSGWGIVLLTNGESLLYSMLGRIDVIVDAVAAQLVGSAQPGTLAGLYIAFDAIVLVLAALQVRTLIRLLRTRGGRARHRNQASKVIFEIIVPAWRELVVPIGILIGLPAVFSAPWVNLVQTDVGVAALGMAILLLGTGVLRIAKTLPVWTGRQHRERSRQLIGAPAR